jgi:hypothetical protein
VKNKEAPFSREASSGAEVVKVFPKLTTGMDETNLYDDKQHLVVRPEVRREKDKTQKRRPPTHWMF